VCSSAEAQKFMRAIGRPHREKREKSVVHRRCGCMENMFLSNPNDDLLLPRPLPLPHVLHTNTHPPPPLPPSSPLPPFPQLVNLVYNQAVYNFISGNYVCPEQVRERERARESVREHAPPYTIQCVRDSHVHMYTDI
jgi:hypothetical protein